jgi:predicted O-methyltransferase YrrM
MKNFYFAWRYLKYLLSAKTAHGIHSPFVFQLYNEVICQKGSYYPFDKIEYLRKKLLASKKKIEVTDFGTGKSGERTIKEITERSLKHAKYAQLLFRLAYHFKPNIVLELGTSFGITTCYLGSAIPNGRVITIEGSSEIMKKAKQNFLELGLKNIETIIGNFDDVLPSVIDSLPILDFIFIDGNHRKDSLLRYFLLCLEKAHNHSVFVFDDIHWSEEMEEAWEEVKAHPKVNVTLDLFFLGIVFLRMEQAKEHFILRF